MFILYSRLLSRLDSIEQRLAQGEAVPAPDPTPEPDPHIALDHIAELSKNARATWFGLLGLLAFVGVTLLGHKDADFFAWGAETQLPLINVQIPVKSFFIFAPALVAALYIYLHLYLMNLWDALADLKQQAGATPISDRVFPWLISHAALWYRNRVRGDGCAAPRALGWVVVAVSLALGWLFGILVLGGLWLRFMPAHNEGLTLWIALCLLAATLTGLTGFMAARARMKGKPRETVAGAHEGRRWLGGVLAVLLAFLSWETTEGGILLYTKTNAQIIPLYPANLREAVLIAKPDDWQPYDRWLRELAKAYRKENDIEPKVEMTPAQQRAFRADARDEWSDLLESLTGPELRQRDLRNADLARAVLPRADLRGARLDGANLTEAELQGAELNCWEPSDGERYCTSLQGADLIGAQMKDADCRSATLRGALLQSADVTCDNLKQEQLEQAVGDSRTALPDGLTVASCLKTLPADVEDALAHHPEEEIPFVRSSRQQVRDALLCGPGEEPVRIPHIATDQQ